MTAPVTRQIRTPLRSIRPGATVAADRFTMARYLNEDGKDAQNARAEVARLEAQ